MKFPTSWLKALPLLVLIIFIILYKFRYTLHLTKPTVEAVETIDSSYLLNRVKKEIVAKGYIMEREFSGVDAVRYPNEHSMDSGMDMINNDQFYVIKLYDDKYKTEIYIAIRDLTLLSKIPFSYSFENGTKVLVTAFIKNKSGVNAMYGGTIHNNRGKLKLTGYNKTNNLVTGELEADLDAVIENGTCDIRNFKFQNVILQHNKIQ